MIAETPTDPRMRCDLMVSHGYVVTMDEERRVFGDAAIAIKDGTIVALGPTPEVVGAWRAARHINARGNLVHPGFLDGHYHAGLHLSRGAITDNPNPPPQEGGAGPGVFTRWINALTDEDEYASALMAAVELVKNGFTGFVEAATAFSPDAVAEAVEAVGIRVSLADCMIWDLVGGEPMAAEITRAPCDFNRARSELGGQLKRNGDSQGLVRGHVALYGMGSASVELMQEAKRLADESGTVFHQHQNFMQADADYDIERFGKPALVFFAEQGLIGQNSVFTHMNALTDAEADAVVESGMGLVWHPGNYMYYGIAAQTRNRFPELHWRGTAIAFGTDVAKVWAFGELGFIGYLMSRAAGEYLPSEALLEMFTLGGARAMGLQDEIGALAVGKRADLVIRDAGLADAQPNVDPIKQLMLVSRTKGVDTVLCNGEIVVRGGRLTRLDEEAVYELARVSARRMAERARIKVMPPWPLIS
jgi:cytosine/adenosine deaminase-related metal-dependent hydrolase